ncbi:hypothetical protein GXS47_003587 [Salmonella enterica]|nr:hypothetical protein [Salmonella enterica]
MGVYRWYLIFPLIVYSALSYSVTRSQIINAIPSSFLMSRSANVEQLTDAQCQARPAIDGIMTATYTVPDGTRYASFEGCIYESRSTIAVGVDDGKGGYRSHWVPVYAITSPDGGGDTGDTGDTGSDDTGGGDTGDTGDTGGGSTDPSNPDITPPVNPPVKPPFINPDSNSISQLYEQFLDCGRQLNSIPLSDSDDYDPTPDYNFNALARQCNAIYDRYTSLIKPGEINGGSDDNHNFLTGDGNGHFYHCRRNPYTPQEVADMGKLYPGPVLGLQSNKFAEREIGYNCHIVHDSSDGKDKNHCSFHLNFNYTRDDGKGTSVCNSVYASSLNQGGSDAGSQGGTHDTDTGNTGNTGNTGGDTDSGDDSGPGLVTPSLDVPELTLAPLWNIWPSARDFKITLPAAQCPVFNIDVFGTTHKIDTFCTIFTPDIIAIIRAICILTASIISFVIVLRS